MAAEGVIRQNGVCHGSACEAKGDVTEFF